MGDQDNEEQEVCRDDKSIGIRDKNSKAGSNQLCSWDCKSPV